MTTITLYKKCVLQKDYREVLHPNVRDSYLNTLEQVELTTTGDLFMRFNDRINLPFNKIGYNYMRVELEDFKFFAFIDLIDIHNQTIDVTYSLDVWNTFFDKCEIRNGILSRTLWYNASHERYLPVDLDGNESLIKEEEAIYSYPTIIIDLQFYNLSSAGEISDRRCVSVALGSITNSGGVYLNGVTLSIIESIIAKQATESFVLYNNDNTSDNYYYDIINITMLPYQWESNLTNAMESRIPSVTSSHKCKIDNNDGLILQRFLGLQSEVTLYSRTIRYNDIDDYANKFIGPLSNCIELKQNGLPNVYRYTMCQNGETYLFYLNANNKIIDITSDLRIRIPFTTITGETAVLRELSAELSYQQGKAQQYNAMYNLGTSVVGGIIGTAMGNPLAITGAVNSLGNNVSDIVLGNTKSEQAIAEKYASSSPLIDCKSSAWFNTLYICNPIKISVNNLTEVQSAILENGFKVKYLIQGLPDDTYTKYVEDYNVIKYGSLTIIGECAHNYLENIKRILESGTRIWYTNPYPIQV